MKPENSSAIDRGRSQKGPKSYNTVPPSSIPPENRAEQGAKHAVPPESQGPNDRAPKTRHLDGRVA